MKKNRPFHLVDYSPWPLTSAMSMMIMLTGSVKWFHFNENNLFLLGMMITLMIMFQWWRDIIRESTYQGFHTTNVMEGSRWGMILFIVSEVFFFFFFFVSFFWAFFHGSLSPSIEIGGLWPSKGIIPINPMSIPLLNTIILISSGITITWTHRSLLNNMKYEALKSLIFTVLLGLLFSFFQGYEYWEAPFSIADSIYGSTFFMSTGFHGIHVLIGTTFLTINIMRIYMNLFSSYHYFSFEAAAWYWHFVDVVWLFLFISIYWWGN
uniref:Cytochrome c oxidase subunit 3 n=2 Tax=Endopterygota TaxID=33392 RepID=A0A1W6Q568_9HYME|nr:cytochrome c oxidase subunit III [Corynis lateralis]